MSNIVDILLFDQVIHADDFMAQADEIIAKVRAKKSCATRNQSPFHLYPPLCLTFTFMPAQIQPYGQRLSFHQEQLPQAKEVVNPQPHFCTELYGPSEISILLTRNSSYFPTKA
jgi:hypothetical protein